MYKYELRQYDLTYKSA